MSASSRQVVQARLRSGLEVRLKEIHTAPLVSLWLWYRVGSRNEPTGLTGASHWVEHLLFKGTPSFPVGVLDRAISRDGGMWNALTNLDWTTYFHTVPADRAAFSLSVEADRMVNSLFDPAEVEAERTVVISERQGGEDEPTFRLSEEVQAMAFRVHPYHHEVIGHMADLMTMSRDDLYGHYRRHYVPSNAVLSLAGDLRVSSMLKEIKRAFGATPAGPMPEVSVPAEPPARGEKRVVVEGPGETVFLDVAYRAPAAREADFLPMLVLDCILSGAKSLNVFGAGIPNATSRLYRSLVEKGLASSIAGGLLATKDPFLYTISVTVRPGRKLEKVLSALDEEIERVVQGGVTQVELAKAVKQSRALFAYGSESITNQAFWLGFSEMFADHTWFETYLERLSSMTPDDVLRAARRILVPQNRVVGVYKPSDVSSHEG